MSSVTVLVSASRGGRRGVKIVFIYIYIHIFIYFIQVLSWVDTNIYLFIFACLKQSNIYEYLYVLHAYDGCTCMRVYVCVYVHRFIVCI